VVITIIIIPTRITATVWFQSESQLQSECPVAWQFNSKWKRKS